MGRPYVRKSIKNEKGFGNHNQYTCLECGEVYQSKLEYKKHECKVKVTLKG